MILIVKMKKNINKCHKKTNIKQFYQIISVKLMTELQKSNPSTYKKKIVKDKNVLYPLLKNLIKNYLRNATKKQVII
jgi:hypothetical protein